MVNNDDVYNHLSGILKYCPKKSELNPHEHISINNSLASIRNSNYARRINCIDGSDGADSQQKCFDLCKNNPKCSIASYKNMSDPIKECNLKKKCLLNKNINFNSAYPTKYPCLGSNCNSCHLYEVTPPKHNWMPNNIHLMTDKNVTTYIRNSKDYVNLLNIDNTIPTDNFADLRNHNMLKTYNSLYTWNKYDKNTNNEKNCTYLAKCNSGINIPHHKFGSLKKYT